jgi:hypothetical protein
LVKAKGKKEESFVEDLQKSSPPFGKGRRGGISEKALSKSNIDDLVKSPCNDGFVKGSRRQARKN